MLSAQAHRDHPTLIDLIAQRWRAWKLRRDDIRALEQCGPNEFEAIARDLFISSSQLSKLAGMGADAAKLLYRRMADLGLDRARIAATEPMVMREMQINCSLCNSKARCIRDIACHANTTAWSSYCPNGETLGAFAGRVPTARKRAASPAAAVAAEPQRTADRMLSAILLFTAAWLVLLANPRSLNLPYEPALSTVVETQSAAAPAIDCLDAGCLSAPQQIALHTLRTMQSHGWVGSTERQLQLIRPASLLAQGVHEGEAAVCRQGGGTTHYGFMFQNGCSVGRVNAALLDGYKSCQPMAGGGVCLYR